MQKTNEVIIILNILSFGIYLLGTSVLLESATGYLPFLVKSKDDIQASLKLPIIFSVS